MKTLIVSPESGIKNFENYNIVYTCENPYILSYESFHADMQVCVCDNDIIVPPYFYDYYKKNIKDKNVLRGNSDPFGHYPCSAAYNVAVTDNFAVCNTAVADKKIIECIELSGREIIEVKQGYSKCSVCIAGDAVITSDMGIYRKVCGKMPVLLITGGYVNLPGCEYGFIGGASGFNGKLIFSGDISKHPDFRLIDEFLRTLKIEYTCFSGELTDYGTLIFL